MKSLNAHIAFPGQAREALEFYQTVFGGEIQLYPVGDRHDVDLPADAIFHSELKGDGFLLMAADTSRIAESLSESPRISLHISCTDRAELERCLSRLSEAGSVHCGVGPAFGGLFAMVTDRYTVTWYLTCPG